MKKRIEIQKADYKALSTEFKKKLIPANTSFGINEKNTTIEEYNSSIKILPSHPKNIMLDIFYDLNKPLPEAIDLTFYTEKKGAYASDVIYPSWHCKKYIMKDKEVIKSLELGENVGFLKILQTNELLLNDEDDGVLSKYLVNEIFFSAQNLSTDFWFLPYVSFKYVYRVLANGYKDFCMEDGKCAHNVGDSFEDNLGNKLTVMEINHNEGLVYCSTIGFSSNWL